MRAAQWNPDEKKVVVRDVPIPQPGPSQFLIKMASASLCHSDVMMIEAGHSFTLGHEGAGYIEEIHESVADIGFNKGDPVGFLYTDGCCYQCEGCQLFPLHCFQGNQKLHGYSTDGFFAEYAVVDAQNCVRLPESIDVKTASPYFCAGLTAFHSVDSCDLTEGQWLAVVGAGGLGQFAIQIGKAMKLKVIAVDINDETLEVCKELGADAVYNSKSNESHVEDIKQLTQGGVHATCVFSNADAAYSSAPSLLKFGGLLMAAGIPKNPLSINAWDLASGKLRIKGESTGTAHRMQKGVDFFAEHGIKPAIEHRKLEDLNDMIDELNAGNAMRRKLVSF
ncbi:hypothetical protein CKM354_000126400 [Cercospora kikuchii]|uniref:Enoyl reductase (ER) domain-containing protein n=1 Tax=Cercospora kikuchii TaxID=84275 RepID=A0A9P3F833_9PEZI|nr:uncharacterized protein CKM354_000126400 [Cercospora kikuchii]GIZ37831.1 hypothetical protein CKM354_000126400 [Cercospora kikuchii]